MGTLDELVREVARVTAEHGTAEVRLYGPTNFRGTRLRVSPIGNPRRGREIGHDHSARIIRLVEQAAEATNTSVIEARTGVWYLHRCPR
ncbi:MAG: hypothetical protein KatS3mg051_2155 [Anaerolineae bacterium]|nr:MAG: hypothetical protein KatS3mg051_2155 [Anaerolineae bacterium]